MESIISGVLVALVGLVAILGFYSAILGIYYFIISFWGYGEAKRDYEIIEDQSRFLILVAAHNEENVIRSSVENLRKIDYNEDLYDIVVVNDNSSDSTRKLCKNMRVAHVNTGDGRFEREGVGKPGGLQYALRTLGFEYLKYRYDLVMVMDADNHVSTNILKEINSQYISKGRPTAIQTYLDSKNYEHVLALGYSNAFIMMNRFFQLAKYRIGLPNCIGGTGFAVDVKYLIDSGGFNYKSLTEDLEMAIEIVSRGGSIVWNHFARIYDEKPTDIKVSVRQRTRWMQGHWYVAITYLPILVKRFFKEWKFKYIDQIFHLFSSGKAIQILLLGLTVIVSGIGLLFADNISIITDNMLTMLKVMFGVGIMSIFMFGYQTVFMTMYAYKKDSRIKVSYKTFLGLFLYSFTFIYCQVKGLLKWRQQHTWVKTEHKVETLTH